MKFNEKMDLTSAIIGLVMLGLFVLPIVIMSTSNKKKNQLLLNELKGLAAQNNHEISEYDIQTQFSIGITPQGERIFFVRKGEHPSDIITTSLPLNSIKMCTLHTENRSVKLKNSTEAVIEKLELLFQIKSKDQKYYSWLLYDAEITPQLDRELEIGNKWVSIIKKAI